MRINLLPPEVLERQRTRRRTVGAVIVGVIVLAAIGAYYFLQVSKLNEVEEDITAQEATNAQLQAQIAELQDVAGLEQEIARTRDLLNSLLSDRVLWSDVLRSISLVIPSEVWLEGLNGQAGTATTATEDTAAPTTTGSFTPGQGIVGQISFTGKAFSHRDVALWLSRLEDVRGFVNPWLTTSTKSGGEGVLAELVTFNSSVDLSEQALARRRGGGNP
jgi:Tfp pilus assembly protein PilN